MLVAHKRRRLTSSRPGNRARWIFTIWRTAAVILTFVLCPDGTTMLIDAGTTEDSTEVSSAQRPNASLRPGEWIANYIMRHMRAAGRQELDYFLLTHLHPDHLGDLGPGNPASPQGDYRLTGVMDVDARMRIGKLIDRDFPEYAYPVPQQAAFALNYLKYVRYRLGSGGGCEQFGAGRADQIRLIREPGRYPGFVVRNLAANGIVWTGQGDNIRRYFPDLQTLRKEDYPTENMCSVAIRISYGKFDYFTGGDLTCDTEETDEPWRDIETPVARACGPVEVAVANHHAYVPRPLSGPEFCSCTSAPRVRCSGVVRCSSERVAIAANVQPGTLSGRSRRVRDERDGSQPVRQQSVHFQTEEPGGACGGPGGSRWWRISGDCLR